MGTLLRRLSAAQNFGLCVTPVLVGKPIEHRLAATELTYSVPRCEWV